MRGGHDDERGRALRLPRRHGLARPRLHAHGGDRCCPPAGGAALICPPRKRAIAITQHDADANVPSPSGPMGCHPIAARSTHPSGTAFACGPRLSRFQRRESTLARPEATRCRRGSARPSAPLGRGQAAAPRRRCSTAKCAGAPRLSRLQGRTKARREATRCRRGAVHPSAPLGRGRTVVLRARRTRMERV